MANAQQRAFVYCFSMTRFLMCAPTHFRVAYDINPWMTRNVGSATVQAQRQWERLVALLLDEGGASIELVEPHGRSTRYRFYGKCRAD